MLDNELTYKVISEALRRGGDFAELYVEKRHTTSLSFEDGRLERSSGGLDAGASVRVIRGRNISFVSTDRLDEGSLLKAARLAGEGAADGGTEPVKPAAVSGSSAHPVRIPVATVATGDKAALLEAANSAARSAGKEVAQVTAGYSDTVSEVMVANSEGCLAGEERTRVRLVINVIAIRDGIMQTGYESIGAHRGMELFNDTGPASVGEKAAAKAIRMLDSRPAPGGKMTVVLHRGFGGVLFHEACGHGLEADAVEKGASVFAGRVGEKVASELVTLIDDGSIANAWGSNAFDDEGAPTGRNVLVEEGRLTGFLYDRLRARNAGVEPTGNGRRQSYRYPPIPRMTNTYIITGTSTTEEIIGSTEKGFYAKTLSGGQVEPASGDFVFGVSEGYLIENGRITHPLRGATLIGNGLTALNNVDMIADDFEFNIGVCGKDGQGVPVGSGQPTLRIRNMTIGGTEV